MVPYSQQFSRNLKLNKKEVIPNYKTQKKKNFILKVFNNNIAIIFKTQNMKDKILINIQYENFSFIYLKLQ